MNYRRELQIGLRERYRRLYKAHWEGVAAEFRYFVSWVEAQPSIVAILDAAQTAARDFDPEAWADEHFGHRGYAWPDTEPQRAVLIWHLVRRWAEAGNGPRGPWREMTCFSSDNSAPDIVRDGVEYGVEPLINYLEEQVGQTGDILHLLARLQRRVEWFDRDLLWEQHQADTKFGEKVYDEYLRRYLFDQGVDYPFSQPDSPSGTADVVGELGEEDPLVCEVKLFDGDQYTAAYLGTGVQQALSYAKDYGKADSYLVIFNLSDRGLELPSDDEPKAWPPRLHVDGVTVHLVAVRAKPPSKSASKQGKPAPRVIRRSQLVSE